MAFLTPAQFVKVYDTRRVQQLLSDTGTPVASGDLATDENLLNLLAESTEMILSAVQVGTKYTEDELQDLADSSTSGYLVRRLCADLAYGLLVARRGTSAADMDRLAPNWKFAQFQLQQLREGTLIFPRVERDEHPGAGNPRTTNLTTLPGAISNTWASQATIHPNPTSVTDQYPYFGTAH